MSRSSHGLPASRAEPRRPAPLSAERPAILARPGGARAVPSDLAFLLAGLAVALLWDVSGLDLPAMRLVGTNAGFAWRQAWPTAHLLHDGGRLLSWLVFALLALDAARWRPAAGGPARSARVGALLLTLLCVAAVGLAKHLSTTSCPWDLVEFGGRAAHLSHWRFGVPDGGPGRCFPSGHAGGAFAFLPQVLLWRPHDARRARAWLIGVFSCGLLFGAAQWLRGAHYPSHTLWAAWLCGAVTVGGWRLGQAGSRAAGAARIQAPGC